MVAHDLQPGQLVTSTAGRDKGQPFFVIKLLDDRYVAVADGRKRSVRNPKRKNVRHLQPHRWIHHELARRLINGDIPSDEQIRQMLEEAIESAMRDGLRSNG